LGDGPLPRSATLIHGTATHHTLTLKMSKLGGLFGSVTGAGGLGKTESKMEYKLFAVGETSPRLQSSSSAKEEGDENSAGVAISAEARAVVSEVKKRKG